LRQEEKHVLPFANLRQEEKHVLLFANLRQEEKHVLPFANLRRTRIAHERYVQITRAEFCQNSSVNVQYPP
jgi:hypothetical protein